MKTLLNNNIELGVITLQVKDLQAMIDFYAEKIGLKLIEQETDSALLGTPLRALLRLVTSEDVVVSNPRPAGLYHLALLLPEQQDLLAMIYFLQDNDVRISGASDHLFSEAIYLNDPEGNGIEIYADRPRSEWVVDENDALPLVSDPLNIEAMIANFDGRVLTHIPDETLMGHMHLSVREIEKGRAFYVDLLGMGVQMELPSALFLSKDNYHHHVALNIWEPVSQTNRTINNTGLVSFEIIVDNLKEIKESLSNSDLDYTVEENYVSLNDGQGITVILVQA